MSSSFKPPIQLSEFTKAVLARLESAPMFYTPEQFAKLRELEEALEPGQVVSGDPAGLFHLSPEAIAEDGDGFEDLELWTDDV